MLNEAEIQIRLQRLSEAQKAEMAQMLKSGEMKTVVEYLEYLDSLQQKAVEETARLHEKLRSKDKEMEIEQRKGEILDEINKRMDEIQAEKEEAERLKAALDHDMMLFLKPVMQLAATMMLEPMKYPKARIRFYITADKKLQYYIDLNPKE